MKILNFGSLNCDYVYSVPHMVQEGETLSSRKLEVFPGGKGLNQERTHEEGLAVRKAKFGMENNLIFSNASRFRRWIPNGSKIKQIT